jgi:hypothetical protein
VSLGVNPGQGAAFAVMAIGVEPIAYQWFKGETPLDGQTATELHLANAQPADAGNYFASATNPGGTTFSSAATLTVFDPPRPNSAEFRTSSLPPQLFTGQSVLAGFTFHNTSDLTWSAAQGYALAVTDDPAGLLPDQSTFVISSPFAVIPPGQRYQFIGRIEAPSTPGQYAFKLRMTELPAASPGATLGPLSASGLPPGVPFGDEPTFTVEVIEPTNFAPDWEIYR